MNQSPSDHLIQVAPDCLQIRGRVVHHYALLDESGVTLIDGGFLSNRPERTIAALQNLGYPPDSIHTILLTHGHIDHTLNLSRWKQLTPAHLWAPRIDQAHLEGRYRYRSFARVCGVMEQLTRKCFQYEAATVDHWFSPRDQLNHWEGLEVIPLPGHTLGHVGFHSASRGILFSADLFANFYGYPKPPPPWFNVDRKLVCESIERALGLTPLHGVLPSHCHRGTPKEHLRDLNILSSRLGLQTSTK